MYHYLKQLRFRIRALINRRSREAEMVDEMRQHLEALTRSNIAAGYRPEEAIREAHIRFGNVGKIKRQCRDVRCDGWLERIFNEIRFSVRFLRRTRSFGLAVFLVIFGLMLAPISSRYLAAFVTHPSTGKELARSIQLASPGDPTVPSTASVGSRFLAFQEQTIATSGFGAVENATANRRIGIEPTSITVWYISDDLFSALGVKPILGRVFLPNENREGTDTEVLITESFWRAHFNASPDILGRSFVIDQRLCTIIGVLAPDTRLPSFLKGDVYRLFVLKSNPLDTAKRRQAYHLKAEPFGSESEKLPIA